VIEKKFNEIEIGYVLVDGQDVVTGLLKAGLAKIRNEKVQSEHIEEYKDAED
jgi:endonuclease YncB( thermonuclease family)